MENQQIANTPTSISLHEFLTTYNGQAEYDKTVQKALDTARKKWEVEKQNAIDEITTARNVDLDKLKTKLKDFEGTQQAFAELQSKYEADAKEWQAKAHQQAYEFEVKNMANNLEFSSNGAKNYFIDYAIKSNLTMKDGQIMGLNDLVEKYKQDDPTAFKQTVEQVAPQPHTTPQPQFVSDGVGKPPTENPAAFLNKVRTLRNAPN